MASVLLTNRHNVMNTLAFSGINFFPCKFMDHGEKESRRHNLALELSFSESVTNEINNEKLSFSQQKTFKKTKHKNII